jgi:hypothetical protein
LTSAPAPRPEGLAPVLAIARNLAEEFDTVPLPMVSRAVRTAVEAAELFGESLPGALPTIERLAREDLTVVSAGLREQQAVAAAS